MTVVQFPDEIIRQFLARLDSSRRFSDYLDALAYCARKELDPSPLHAWWKGNAPEIVSDNFELDFVDFLNGIITSTQTWEERRAERLAEVAAAKKTSEDEGKEGLTESQQSAKELWSSINRQTASRKRFMEENPEYRCVSAATEYHTVFSTIFDERDDPLRTLARWASEMLPCGLPEREQSRGYDPDFSKRVRFGYEDERPAAFLIGSKYHAHVLELADWVAELVQNADLSDVLQWSLTHNGPEAVPSSVMQAVRHCSHATFVHLIHHQEVEPADVDGLVALLKLPLAINASASGPPYLLPDFSFLGSLTFYDSAICYMSQTIGRGDLVEAWRQFFSGYRRLRLRSNGSRGFSGCDELFRAALINYAGDDRCFHDTGARCVEEFIRDIEPDESCVLEHFLCDFVEMDDIIRSDAKRDSQWVPAFSLTKALRPMLSVFRRRSMHELASAMLAYYLVMSAIGADGNLDELEGLDEAIIESRRLPGSGCVERALEVICGLARERGHKLTQMKFEQFLVPEDRKVRELILAGEGEIVEFKSTLRVNLHTDQPDRKIEHAVLKTIAAFLNKRGGILLVGVDDAGSVLGTEADSFPNADKLLLHFKNLVNATAPDALDLIDFKMVTLEQKEILYVECRRGERPIYLLNRDTKQHEFYVRRGPATDQLDMPDAFAYIQKEFTGSRLVGLE